MGNDGLIKIHRYCRLYHSIVALARSRANQHRCSARSFRELSHATSSAPHCINYFGCLFVDRVATTVCKRAENNLFSVSLRCRNAQLSDDDLSVRLARCPPSPPLGRMASITHRYACFRHARARYRVHRTRKLKYSPSCVRPARWLTTCLARCLRSREQDWTPEGGSKNSAFRGSNGSLGKRANKKSQGILTIRFEMPFNVRCGACGHTIAKGVRFNAEKKKIGNYHSTPIWSFTMHSACCHQLIEVQTDPANTEYNVVKGAERCVGGQGYEAESPDDLMQMLEYQNDEERAALLANPLAMLERSVNDEQRAKARARTTLELSDLSKARWSEDYNINKALRRSMRGQRKEANALKKYSQSLGLPEHVKLKPEREEDKQFAKRVFTSDSSRFDRRSRDARRNILKQSIFAGVPSTSGSTLAKASSSSLGTLKRPSSVTSNASRAAKLAKRER